MWRVPERFAGQSRPGSPHDTDSSLGDESARARTIELVLATMK